MAKPSREPDPGAAAPLSGAARGGRRIRRRWLAALVALVAIVALIAVTLTQWLSPAPSQTIWQRITAGITDGGVPKDTALEAFAYLYRVDIPGVVVPSGADGSDAPVSGSGAMRWVQADWSQLSAAQQAVINRYLPPETTKGTHQMTPAPSAAGLAPGGAPGFAPAVAYAKGGAAFDALAGPRRSGVAFGDLIGWPFATNVAPDASPDLALAIADDMASIIVHLGPKLGVPVIYPGSLPTPDITLTLSDTDGGTAALGTVPSASDGHYSPCNVTAYKNAWSNAAWTANDKVSPALHVMLTHEVIHCYQNAVIGDISKDLGMPSWIIEGTADYLAVNDTGTVGPGDAGAWADYLTAENSLTTRSYDAMGYYALLAYLGRDLWGTMATAWRAAANSTPGSDAFIGVLHGDDSDVRDKWAESYANATAWQDPWILHGFGAPADKSATLHEVQAVKTPGWIGSLPPRSNTLLYVKDTAGEVVTVVTDGLASVHDSSGNTSIAFQQQTFCTVESCVCPAGTALAGQDMATRQLAIPFVTALNAPAWGSKYAIISNTLEELCKQATPKPQGTPSYGPCGQSCSQSNGDPHMLTVNKYRYDFQAAGEFTLLKSADGSVDIQARQEPFGQGYASINTAIAAKVGSHRVGVYMTGSGLQARVDGTVADLTAGAKDLGGGARIAAVSKGFEIDLADGTQIWTLSVGQYGINAQVKPSAALQTSGVGLLGVIVPGGLGVPALPDGSRLPAATSAAQRKDTINGQFADAWRLTDSATLFDYDAGKSTSSYTVKPFPKNPKYGAVSDLTADQAAAGASACSAITDPGLHDNCVFDVGVTGQAGFADTYQATQAFYDSGVAAAATSTARAAGATPTPGAISGNVFTVTQGAGVGGYALGSDNTVYLTAQTGDAAYSLIAFDPVAGKIVKQVSIPAATPVHFAAGSVWLPGIKTDSNGHNCSVTRFDATTLAEQATIATPCSAFGSANLMASDGDALWYMDWTKTDPTTDLGGVMTRIDPGTNAPGTSVALPSTNGYLVDSQGAFFYRDKHSSYFRLTTGSTSFESLGSFKSYFTSIPGGTGLWAQDSHAKTALYFTQAGSPQATLQVGGSLIAGDATAAYVEVDGLGAGGGFETQLWRYPVDGSTPTQIAAAPALDGGPLNYFGDPMPIANGNGVLKIWPTHHGSQISPILLQWTPAR